MTYSQIEVAVAQGVGRILINRPAQRNALTGQTIEELTQAFTSLSRQDDLRCILLSGSGTESFCAGADLRDLHSKDDPAQRRSFFVSIAKLITVIRQCPVPVISVVYGFALAGGLGLVASSDIVLAADDAVFGLPEVSVGLAPMVVLSPLEATVSPRQLAYLALSGERFSATDALRAGLVTQLMPKDKLNQEAERLCDIFRQRGPHAVRATKAALRDVPLSDRTTFIFELADRSALVSLSPEALEGITAFQEKRTPSWKV